MAIGNTITTIDVSAIGQYSAITGGSGILSDEEVLSRGIVMVKGDASAYYPDDRVYELLDGSTGDFSTTLDLEPSSNYTVRAYLYTQVGDDYTTTYGDNKNFNTLQLDPIYQAVCLGCYWFNKLFDPSDNAIVTVLKDPSNMWHCAAFPDSSGYTIPENIRLGEFTHDVSIEDQYWIDNYGEAYYPVFEKTPYAENIVVSDVFRALKMSPYSNGFTTITPDASEAVEMGLDNIVPGKKYIHMPVFLPGINVNYVETDVSYGESLSLIDTITINAGPANATKTSSSDGSLGEMAFDSTNLYICIGANSWKKIALVNI